MAQVGVRQGPLVFVDIETTGGSYKFARVLEIGVVRVENNRVVATYQSLIDTGGPVPAMITRLTGIKDKDVVGAPTFRAVAEELAEILDGAVFVAHNVQFDYGFLRMEFERLGVPFRPKLLCTVRLSRKLYPHVRGHKLQDLIERYGLAAESRHRAYDDALVLWQFYKLVLGEFDLDTIDIAIAAQMKSQNLPVALDKALVDNLPNGPGVYIFEDEAGMPLYVGKSVHIRQRVLSHFAAFHETSVERRIAAEIRHVSTRATHGELGALLTESELIKELQPLHNRQLRKHSRVTLALRSLDDGGYFRLRLEESDTIDPAQADNIMAVFSASRRAQESLQLAAREYYLCSKLMNLEKAKAACFGVQLNKCRGACIGAEDTFTYNARFMSAFEQKRLHHWGYKSPVLITEQRPDFPGREGFIVDQWCLVARLREDEDGQVTVIKRPYDFDLDMYKILRSYLENAHNKPFIKAISIGQMSVLINNEVFS